MIHWQHDPIAFDPSTWYDRRSVFNGSIIVEDVNIFTNRQIDIYAYYTGVSVPLNQSEVTLKDGLHLWREVQASAVTKPWDSLQAWTKLTLKSSLLLDPPFPTMEIAGFRDLTTREQSDGGCYSVVV